MLGGLLLSEVGVNGRWKSLWGEEERLPGRLLARLSGLPESDTGVKGRRNPLDGDAGRLADVLPGLLPALRAGGSMRPGMGLYIPFGVWESYSPVNGGESVGPKVGAM